MSKDIIVLTPNGRRQKVHCTPDTSILQVLEDVCAKQGFPPSAYDLKHHNHVLDLTTTVRWSNLPNKATLELVETERTRQETNVTVGLLLQDGERRTADFSPNTSLFELVTSLAPTEFSSLDNPSILYMRQEVAGEHALKHKTLRHLGLTGGRAILRLLNKPEEATQANVSAVYRRPLPAKNDNDAASKARSLPPTFDDVATPGTSEVPKKAYTEKIVPIDLIKKEKDKMAKERFEPEKSIKILDSEENLPPKEDKVPKPIPMEVDTKNALSNSSLNSQENLERRLRIEDEITFLGPQKAIAFIPEGADDELEDLPDDFYELTIEEARHLYADLQNHRIELENTPLITATKKEDITKQTSLQRLSLYKNVVVRVQFPDHIVLQGIFLPSDTINDVNNFIKAHLQTPEKPFHIFTTPLKETLDPHMTLLEAGFVPCVHMHFKWLKEEASSEYLKRDIYSNTTASDAASILASKYRAPSRRKLDLSDGARNSGAGTSSSKNSKVPKWFKK